MTQQPFLLPWVRVLLLIRSITLDDLGARGVARCEAGTPARLGDAPADRAGGLVDLARRGRRLRAAHAALFMKETELAKALRPEGCWS
jgi:hypothetical protein